jgi:hypothetical protein
MSAPFLPSTIPPMPAPVAADPPMMSALFPHDRCGRLTRYRVTYRVRYPERYTPPRTHSTLVTSCPRTNVSRTTARWPGPHATTTGAASACPPMNRLSAATAGRINRFRMTSSPSFTPALVKAASVVPSRGPNRLVFFPNGWPMRVQECLDRTSSVFLANGRGHSGLGLDDLATASSSESHFES